MIYFPFVKSKRGELKALANLNSRTADNILPVIDVHRKNNPEKELENHLDSVCSQIITMWESRKFIVDLFDLDASLRTSSGEHPLRHVLRVLDKANANFVPCTGLDRDESFNKELLNSGVSGSIALRLQREDIQAPVLSISEIFELLSFLGIEPVNVILLLDLREIVVNPLVLASECAEFLGEIYDAAQWETVVLAGSAMPRSLSERVDVNSEGIICRSEIELWNAVRGQVSEPPVFGDYGITNPEYIDLDPRIISSRMTPSIRYTLVEDWYIVRGESFKKSGHKQYHDLARLVEGSPHYYGQGYSYGDRYLAERATSNGNTGPGTPETWITAGLNHHIEQTTARILKV